MTLIGRFSSYMSAEFEIELTLKLFSPECMIWCATVGLVQSQVSTFAILFQNLNI